MNPSISIIIPIYNVESYLKECLDSVINQSLQNIEIICINDGSIDHSKNILESFCDKRIKIINKQNEGVAKARNDALSIAKGEFVCFIDPDDFYPTNEVLYLLYTKASTNKALICGGSFGNYSNGKITTLSNDPLYFGYSFKKEGFIEYQDYQFDFGFHRFIYHRDFLLQNHIFYPNLQRYEDPVFLVKAMILAKRFYAIKEITYHYRTGHQNMSKWTKKMWNDQNKGIEEVLNLAKKHQLQKLYDLTINRANHIANQLTKNICEGSGFLSSLVDLNDILYKDSPKQSNKPLDFYFEKIDNAFKKNTSPIFHLLMFVRLIHKKSKRYIRIRLFHKNYNVITLFGWTLYEKRNK